MDPLVLGFWDVVACFNGLCSSLPIQHGTWSKEGFFVDLCALQGSHSDWHKPLLFMHIKNDLMWTIFEKVKILPCLAFLT